MNVVCVLTRRIKSASDTIITSRIPSSAEEFLFGDAGGYAFMSNGYVAVPGINDTNEFEDTLEAMTIMGMPEEEQSGEPFG